MKFIRKGSSGHGSTYTPLEPEEYLMLDQSLLRTYTILEPSINKPLKDEVETRERL